MTNTKTTLYRLQWKDYSLNLYFNPEARTKRLIDTYFTYRNDFNLKEYQQELNIKVKPYRLDLPGKLQALKDYYVIKSNILEKEKIYLPRFIKETFQSSYCFWESGEDINGGISEASLLFHTVKVNNALPYRRVYRCEIDPRHYDLDIPKDLDLKDTKSFINYSGRTNMVQFRVRKFCNEINKNIFIDTYIPYAEVMSKSGVNIKILNTVASALCGRLVDQLRYYVKHPDASKTLNNDIVETIDIREIISMSE